MLRDPLDLSRTQRVQMLDGKHDAPLRPARCPAHSDASALRQSTLLGSISPHRHDQSDGGTWGVQMAEGFVHEFQGEVVFMASGVIMVLEMMRLAHIGAGPRPWRELFGLEF
jgi:hypothetical protein